MVDILAGLAAGGVGVVLTIHQPRPDVFRLMHRVMLLSGRGQVRTFPAARSPPPARHELIDELLPLAACTTSFTSSSRLILPALGDCGNHTPGFACGFTRGVATAVVLPVPLDGLPHLSPFKHGRLLLLVS